MLQKTRVDYELVCLSCSCSKIEITFQTENRTGWNSGRKSTACGCGLSGQEAVVKVASGDAHRASAGDEEEGGEERPTQIVNDKLSVKTQQVFVLPG